VAHGEVLNRIVHTEMVKTPRLSVQINEATVGREISSPAHWQPAPASTTIRTLVRTTGRGPLVLRCRSPMRWRGFWRARLRIGFGHTLPHRHAIRHLDPSLLWSPQLREACTLPAATGPLFSYYRAKKKNQALTSLFHQFT